MLRFSLALLAVVGGLEVFCRVEAPLLATTQHRALFKAGVLAQQPAKKILFFGTSRTGESFRPGVLREALQELAPGLDAPAFNLSIQYSSFDILQEVVTRAAAHPGVRLAVVELSYSQMQRRPLPWLKSPAVAEDFDGRVFQWLEQHSQLVQQRKAFVLDSLARWVGGILFASRFDGSEQFGGDYVWSILGRRDDRPAGETLTPWALHDVSGRDGTALPREAEAYTALAAQLRERGIEVVFFVPGTRADYPAIERNPDMQELLARMALVAPVVEALAPQLPDAYFRDTLHPSHLGGSVLTRQFAHWLVAQPRLMEKLRAVQ